MIILDNVVVTDGFLNARFCCDLPRCKGWCCVEGDAGAPLEANEIAQIEDNLEAIKTYMRPEGLKVIEDGDVYDYDENGELVTPLVNGAECAFVYFHDNGTALCAIEKAYLEGKCDFWKPISCHLYPIRLLEKDGFTHILYHEWSVCVPAMRKGATGAGRSLFENQGDVLARQFGLFGACILGGLEVGGEFQEKLDFFWSEVQQLQKVSVTEVECHYFMI